MKLKEVHLDPSQAPIVGQVLETRIGKGGFFAIRRDEAIGGQVGEVYQVINGRRCKCGDRHAVAKRVGYAKLFGLDLDAVSGAIIVSNRGEIIYDDQVIGRLFETVAR